MKTALLLMPLLLSGPVDDRTLVIYEISDLVEASIDPASARPDLTITRTITSSTSDGTKRVTRQAPLPVLAETPVTPKLLASRKVETERLAEVLRHWMEPPLDEGERVRAVSGEILVVLARGVQHRWIEAFLEKQRASRAMYIMEMSYVEAPSGGFASVGYPESSTVLEKEALLALEKRIESTKGFSIKSRPRVQILNNSHMGMSITSGLKYVKEWRLVTVQPGGRKIADPVIETVPVGYSIEGIALELPSKLYGVELHYSLEGVVEPIPTAMVPLGDSGEEAQVARPETTRFDMQARFTLPSGGSALFWAPTPDGDGEIGALIKFRVRS